MKTFTLRNVDAAAITSSHDLKELIKKSLRDGEIMLATCRGLML